MEKPNPCFPIPRTKPEAKPAAEIKARIVDASGIELCSAPATSISAGDCRIELASPQIPNLFSGSYPMDSLVQDFKNFKKSGVPSRFLSFQDGSWTDLSREVFDVLRTGFVAGKTVLEAASGGVSYLFDFLRMSQIDLSTGAQKSIAWIDADGRCFFPRVFVDEQSTASPKLEIEIRIDRSSSPPSERESLKRKRDLSNSLQEHSDESPDSSSTAGSGSDSDRPRWPGTKMLKDGDKIYPVIEQVFLSGIRRFFPNTVIASIYKCSHSGLSRNSRMNAFQMQMQMTKAARGDANVKFAWYGAPADIINGVLAHGFGQPNKISSGSDAYGVGVHLSPAHSPFTSAGLSETDGAGEQHVLLCRVIMGKSEEVPPDSVQFHPSSDQFDSGVDNLENPKWYTVWSTHMNTHILPEYVVSFKASKQPQGPWRMGKSVPSSRLQALKLISNQLKAGRISKDMFVRYIRSLIGDKGMASLAQRMRRI